MRLGLLIAAVLWLLPLFLLRPGDADAARRVTASAAHAKAERTMSSLVLLYGPGTSATVDPCRVRSSKRATCRVRLQTSERECRTSMGIVLWRGALRWTYADDIVASPCSTVDGS